MVTTLLVSISALGFFLLLVQRAALAVALRRRVPAPIRRAPISILKPLCGVDDALEENLRVFAALDYPRFEVLLGVKDRDDAAYPLALAFALRDPRFPASACRWSRQMFSLSAVATRCGSPECPVEARQGGV